MIDDRSAAGNLSSNCGLPVFCGFIGCSISKNPEPIPETAEGRLLGHTNRGVQVYVAVMVR